MVDVAGLRRQVEQFPSQTTVTLDKAAVLAVLGERDRAIALLRSFVESTYTTYDEWNHQAHEVIAEVDRG